MATLIDEWINIASEERNAIVFEDRNKAYGAFPLRKEYPRTLLIALISTAYAIILIAVTPKIIELIKGSKSEVVVTIENTQVDLTAPPPVDPTEPPPPPPPPPPVMETVKFTPPVVVDEPVVDDPPPVQTEETPQVSTETQHGDASAQDIVIPETKGTGPVAAKEEVFLVVEQMPEFPGGEAAMGKYLQTHIVYPEMERQQQIQGKVYIQFKVNSDGQISDIIEKRGVPGGANLTKEAIRVVKTMPAWKPGKMGGRAVSVQMVVPIIFSLN